MIPELRSKYAELAPNRVLEASYGLELGWADVPRSMDLGELGRWSMTEDQIVNIAPPYRGVAGDPAGINPPVGGEINLRPATSPLGEAIIAHELRERFRARGVEPLGTFTEGTHVHVKIQDPPLTLLKNIAVLANREWDGIVNRTALIPDGMEEFLGDPEARRMWGSVHRGRSRHVQDWMVRNLLRAQDFGDFIAALKLGSDGVTPLPRVTRRLVNLHALLYPSKTIEFRAFASTADPIELLGAMVHVERFLARAAGLWEGDLYGGIEFPRCRTFAPDLLEGWKKTKQIFKGDRTNPEVRRVPQEPLDVTPRPPGVEVVRVSGLCVKPMWKDGEYE